MNVVQSLFIVSLVIHFFGDYVFNPRKHCKQFQKNIRWYIISVSVLVSLDLISKGCKIWIALFWLKLQILARQKFKEKIFYNIL